MWKFIPPNFKIGPLFIHTFLYLSLRALSDRIIYMDDYLVEDFR